MSSGGFPMFRYVNKPAVVISTSIFCGLAILCNLFVILIILLSRLRSSGKHLIILALCLVNLYEACAATSLAAQYFNNEQWIHDITYFRYLDLSQFSVLKSFRVLLLISICGVVLMNMFSVNKRFQILISVSMILASIFYSLVLVLPTKLWEQDLTSDCFWEAFQVKNSVTFFPPATILLVLIIDICIVHCCCTRFFVDVTSARESKIPIDVVVASVAFLAYTIPYEIVGTYFSSCSGTDECRIFYIAKAVTSQWELVGNFVLPSLWLLCPDVRREVSRICGRHRSPSEQDNNVTYAMQITEAKM